MAKNFNIHDWQAAQIRKQLDEQSTPTLGQPANEYTGLAAEVAKYVGGRFASWMSPGNPPFGQEYNKPPYFDKFIDDLMKVINDYEDPRMDPAIRSDFDDPVMDEQNVTGTGASSNAGAGEGYMTPKAFKKKKKEY